MIQKAILLASLCCNIAGFSFSQSTPLTDRPDQTEGVFNIEKNTFQFESGFLVDNFNPDQTMYFQQNLFKYGISKRFEIQSTVDFDLKGDVGLYPISLGFKYKIFAEENILPGIAIIARIPFKQLGSEYLIVHKTLPMFRIAFENTLSQKLIVGYNFGMKWQEAESPSYIFSISNSYIISPKLMVFGEYFNSKTENQFWNSIVDFGAIYSFNVKTILDFAIGKYFYGNNEHYITAGFTRTINFK